MPISPGDQAKLDVLNEAMHRLGGAAEGALIADLDTPLQGVPDVRRRYDTIVGALASHPWSWGRQRVQLAQAPAEAQTGYSFAYTSPIGGKIAGIYRDQATEWPFHGYRMIDGKAFSNQDGLWADVLVGSLPDRWPDYFRSVVIGALAYEFCMPITGDRALAQMLRDEVWGAGSYYPDGGMLKSAKSLDGQQDKGGCLTLGPDPLTAARWR
jgi:hypothetical protein